MERNYKNPFCWNISSNRHKSSIFIYILLILMKLERVLRVLSLFTFVSSQLQYYLGLKIYIKMKVSDRRCSSRPQAKVLISLIFV